MPKAGTYLAANLLQCFEMDFTHIHIDQGMFRIFRNNDLKNFKQYGGNVQRAVSGLKNNQFAVGHIPHIGDNIKALKDFKKILIVRDKNEIVASATRYQKEKGPNVFSIINDNNLNRIGSWSQEKDVFVIDFKDIMNNNVEKIDDMQLYLFSETKFDSLESIQKAKEMNSLTKSSIR